MWGLSEDSYQFVMKCPIYSDIREPLLQNLAGLNLTIEINVHLLKSDDESLSSRTNITIFDDVLRYLKKSRNASS